MMNKYSINSGSAKVTVSIVGGRGYAGLELAKLLLKHPTVELTTVFATRQFSLVDELFDSSAAKVSCLTDSEIQKNLTDIVFLCTPSSVSAELAPGILKQGKSVIDLSDAFRDGRLGAEYGLVPYCGPRKKDVHLIANPGCYATAVEMALIPLLKRKLIHTNGLSIDAKSGTTGAGRKATENQIFAEVDGECLPYRVGEHQHLPEILRAVAEQAKVAIDPHFVTHLLPVRRGIECAIFATSRTMDIKEIASAFDDEYGEYKLVRHGQDYERLAKLGPVLGTPMTHISYKLVGQKLYLFSVIDNLMKGAASQAIENLNRLLDLPVTYNLILEA